MSVIADLSAKGYDEVSLPDFPKSIIGCVTLNESIVISRDLDGTVLSRVRDLFWNLKPYCAKSVSVFNFESWTKTPNSLSAKSIIAEMQAIQLVRMHFYPNPRKVSSIDFTALRKMALFAQKHGFSLQDLFNRKACQEALISSLSHAGNKIDLRSFYNLFSELYQLRVLHPLFFFGPSDFDIVVRLRMLAGTYSEYRSSLGQTKVIPSRIYGALISGFNDELDFFNQFRSELLEFYTRRSGNKYYGEADSQKIKNGSVKWRVAIKECGLLELCERFSITGFMQLNSYVISVSSISKNWIHLFTGMRDNEVRTLPANCLTYIRVGGKEIVVLLGYTSKTSGGNNNPTYWISTPIVEKAIVAAKLIGRIASLRNGWNDSDLGNYPLFPMFNSPHKTSVAYVYRTAPLPGIYHTERLRKVISRIPGISLTEADILELERFDGFKDWRSDPDFKVGEVWPLSSHQFRRSLAVYSARSGMVSLGSLANQFKHLTETMTSYYRSDQIFAINFLASEDQQAMIREFEYERRVASLMKYESDVINSSGRLWGGEGNRIQVSRDRGKPLIITTDREATARKFEKGEMVYKESPLGGCTNLNACDRIGTISVFACLDCQYAVLDSNKSIRNIRYGISRLQKSRGMFPPTSPFHQQLSMEIDTIYQQVERAGFGHEIEDLK
ncbi:hypothetical protein [Pseudomonas sp. SG-MS2]|uniref:hypothetical protein n=1 Tax=Pseudomonas sp. SG-MS2 TaxID=1914534 RepID=UPI00137B47B9|nr:hypothetical protein [Pseudomonas sp. SG-MS2]